MIRYSYIIIMIFCFSCQGIRPSPGSKASVNKFSDPSIVAIYDLQDRRESIKLLAYFNDENPVYRAEAAMAFASVQDSAALQPLIKLLHDPAAAVRSASAYALGQIGSSQAQDALMEAISAEGNLTGKANMLEALGKICTAKGLLYLSDFQVRNDSEAAGCAWGIYRAGLRNIVSLESQNKAATLLQPASPYRARLAAANFFSRSVNAEELLPHQAQLTVNAHHDTSPHVRLASVLALGKITAIEIQDTLAMLYESDPDYRVRVSALRAVGDTKPLHQVLFQGLNAKNPNVAVVASEVLLANASHIDEAHSLLPLLDHPNSRVRANIIAAFLKLDPEKGSALAANVKEHIQKTKNSYKKAALLKALGADPESYRFVEDQTFNTKVPVVSTYGMESLMAMRFSKDFPDTLAPHFREIFQRGILSGDMAMIGLAASAIRNPLFTKDGFYKDIGFLYTAKNKLELPEDIETLIELQKTIDYAEGVLAGSTKQNVKSEAPANPYNHPIDWEGVKKVPVTQKVSIATDRGTITLQLVVEDAPGSVINFLSLVRQGFYNGRFFHRVVPNFVAQGGCPRGDGWGGTDYSIRSEFAPLSYEEGYVGMASAGKDTESCQWFITHNPTPHLDGRYTIFAKVASGMDIVHLLEVGDKILKISLLP